MLTLTRIAILSTAALVPVSSLAAETENQKAARVIAGNISDHGLTELDEDGIDDLAATIVEAINKFRLSEIKATKEAIQKNIRLVKTKRRGSGEQRRITAQIKSQQKYLTALEECESPLEMLMPQLSSYNNGDIGTTKPGEKVFQVVGEEDMIIEVGDDNLWVHGLPTKNLADGDLVDLRYLFAVTGNKTYTTAIGGSRTIMVLQPLMKVVNKIGVE